MVVIYHSYKDTPNLLQHTVEAAQLGLQTILITQTFDWNRRQL